MIVFTRFYFLAILLVTMAVFEYYYDTRSVLKSRLIIDNFSATTTLPEINRSSIGTNSSENLRDFYDYYNCTAKVLSVLQVEKSQTQGNEAATRGLKNQNQTKESNQRRLSLTSAILVEPNCHAGVLIVLQQAIKHLGPDYPIVIWHSRQNEMYMKGLIEANSILRDSLKNQQLKLHLFDPSQYGAVDGNKYSELYWYQVLLTSKSFWKEIKTPMMINLQSDTLMCKPPQNEMFQTTSFVGGMSPAYYFIDKNGQLQADEVPLPSEPRNQMTRSHLNGGFSIRNVAWTIACIDAFAPPYRKWVEDDLMNYCLICLDSSQPVTEFQAYSAASDNGATKCFTSSGERLCPFGVHKPWTDKGDSYQELVSNCEGLDKLEQLQHHQKGDTCIAHGLENTTRFQCNCK